MPGYHLPWFAAGASGVDARHGLRLELMEPAPGPENVRAVASGSYDLCLTSVAHYLTAKRQDPDLGAKFIFAIARRSHMAAIYGEGRPAAHGRPIKRVEDLAGASVLGEVDSPFVREHHALMRELGLDPGPLVEVPYADVMLALATGAGDVAPDHVDLLPTYAATAKPVRVEVAALPYYRAGLDVYGSGIVAGSELIEARPDFLCRVVAFARDTLLQSRQNPAAGIDAIQARYPGTDRDHALAGWRCGEELIFVDGDDQRLGSMDAERWRRTLDHFRLAHGGPTPNVEDVFDRSFVEDAQPAH